MNIFLFLRILPFNFLFLISNANQQKEYLTRGETKFTSDNRYYVPFEQKYLDSNQNRFEIQLIHEVFIENQNAIHLTDQMKLFYFQQLNEEGDNIIMAMDNQHLYCLYLIKNYLLDQQLAIHPHYCNITLPYQSCSKLIQIKNQFFITVCKLNDSSIISIFNLDGKVFDQIQLEVEQDCNMDVSYRSQYIIIFEQNCQSNNVYYTAIDEQQFQFKSVKKLELFQGMNIEYIQKIEICDLDRIFFIFQDFMLQYNLMQNNLNQYAKFVNITLLKVFQLCSNTQLELDIENNSQQMRLKGQPLNITSVQYKNAFLIEKILVLFFDDCILAKINDQLQYQINITMSEILQLIGVPYLIGVHQSKLKLFKIQSPRNYYQFYFSQKILYLILTSYAYYNQFYLEQSEIEIVKEYESKLTFNQQERMIYLNDNNQDICLEQKLFSDTLPVNLVAIYENEKYYQINERIYADICKFNFLKYIKIVYFGELNDQIKMLIIFKQKDIIAFVFCQNGQIINEQHIKLITQIQNILVIQQKSILICYEKIISLVIIDDSLSIKTTNYPQEHKIISINKQYIYILIIYEGCNVKLVYILSEKLVQLEQPQPYPLPKSLNCTLNYRNSKSQIVINQDEFIFVSNQNIRYKMKGKIVKVLIDIGSENFIIVVEEQNEFRLEFYRVMRAEVVLCYIIPMYNFKQLLTDTFQYQNQYLMVGAEYQNKSYLLIYNLRNSAISALIYVTEIDESLQFFQFYDSAKKTVVYLYEGKLYFYLLDQFCLKYSLQQPNALIRRKKISILVNSLINNQSATINFQISKLNTDYILSTFNNTQQLSFLNKPLNQDLFRGNIIRVEVQKKEDFVVMLPLNITSEHLYCHYFESNVCFFNNSFIDIQTLKIIYTLSFQQTSFNIRRIIFDEKTQVYQIILSYSKNQNIEILQIEQAEDNLNQSVLISKKNGYSILPKSYVDQVQNIKIIQNLYFFQFIGSNSLIYYKDICQIIINSSQSSNFNNYFTDLAYLSNNTYIYILLDNQKFRIKIIATNDNKIEKAQYCNIDIIQEHEINLLNILNQIDLYYFHIEMKNVEIISVTKKEFIYVLQFLMVQHTNFGLLLEISLNAIKYDDLKIESYRFLRYEKDAQILQMLYADMQFIVAKFQQDGKFFVNVYDIKGDMKNKDYLDSIYRIQSLEYQRIERFNTSHYIIYSKMNKKLYFMTLNQLTVECLGQCTENANLILSNDVSTLTLEISLEIQPGQNYSTIKSVIILTNLLFILIFLKFGRRSRISLQFQ